MITSKDSKRFFAITLSLVLLFSITAPEAFAKVNEIQNLASPLVTVNHDNDVILVGVSEGNSVNYQFPDVGLDHEWRFSIGTNADGSISQDEFGDYVDTETTNFLDNNPPNQQISRAVMNDGLVQITQTAQTNAGNQYITYLFEFENIGASDINNLDVAIYNDWDVDASSGGDTTVYDPITDTAYQFQGTYVGMSSPLPSSNHDINFCCDTSGGILSSPNNANGPLGPSDVTASLSWNLGFLSQGSSKSIFVVMAAADSLDELNSAIAAGKAEAGVVGGEFLSIDTTALILAGAQTNAVWLLSALAVVGSVAFGALYITSKKN